MAQAQFSSESLSEITAHMTAMVGKINAELCEFSKLKKRKKRFSYYTNAETALKIIRNGEVWLRNVHVMNDTSELAYGFSLFKEIFLEDDYLKKIKRD